MHLLDYFNAKIWGRKDEEIQVDLIFIILHKIVDIYKYKSVY